MQKICNTRTDLAEKGEAEFFEITAIPQLDLSEYTVTTDAVGTRTDIAEKIRSKNAEYIFSRERESANSCSTVENQPTLAVRYCAIEIVMLYWK